MIARSVSNRNFIICRCGISILCCGVNRDLRCILIRFAPHVLTFSVLLQATIYFLTSCYKHQFTFLRLVTSNNLLSYVYRCVQQYSLQSNLTLYFTCFHFHHLSSMLFFADRLTRLPLQSLRFILLCPQKKNLFSSYLSMHSKPIYYIHFYLEYYNTA